MKWTKVEDEFPKEGSRVLATDGENHIEVMFYWGKNIGLPDWTSYNPNILDITHWMPLPKLPKD